MDGGGGSDLRRKGRKQSDRSKNECEREMMVVVVGELGMRPKRVQVGGAKEREREGEEASQVRR